VLRVLAGVITALVTAGALWLNIADYEKLPHPARLGVRAHVSGADHGVRVSRHSARSPAGSLAAFELAGERGYSSDPPESALAGGRPGRRICRALPGIRPASPRARRSRNSIWALVDRISSAAQAHFGKTLTARVCGLSPFSGAGSLRVPYGEARADVKEKSTEAIIIS